MIFEEGEEGRPLGEDDCLGGGIPGGGLRMERRAVTFEDVSVSVFPSWDEGDGGSSFRGLTVVVRRELRGERQRGHLCWVSMTRSRQGVQKAWAHLLMMGSL